MLFLPQIYTEVFLRIRIVVDLALFEFIAKYCRNKIWPFDEFKIEISLANMKIIICHNFMIFYVEFVGPTDTTPTFSHLLYIVFLNISAQNIFTTFL